MGFPICKIETPSSTEEINLKSLIASMRSLCKSLMETDIAMFFLSLLAALVNAVSYSNGLKRSKICLMFAKMFELKRVVIAGPACLCNYYVISSFLVVFLCLWIFLRIYQKPCFYGFKRGWAKVTAAFIPVITLINLALLLLGNQAFCNSFDVHKFCSSELLHNTDFKTFTPKYLDAYSYLDISMVSQISSVILCLSWTTALYCHHKKHSRRLTPL